MPSLIVGEYVYTYPRVLKIPLAAPIYKRIVQYRVVYHDVIPPEGSSLD